MEISIKKMIAIFLIAIISLSLLGFMAYDIYEFKCFKQERQETIVKFQEQEDKYEKYLSTKQKNNFDSFLEEMSFAYTQSRIDSLSKECDELIDKAKAKKKKVQEKKKMKKLYSASYFMSAGVINWNGWRWTWYSQNVLPGGGLSIPGRHVDEDGYVCDENNYICLASSSLSYGSVVYTPFGKKGKVYDCGCAAGTLDVYCAW